jgi:N-acetylglutamate synthase-like GNAT family acetyltransferase
VDADIVRTDDLAAVLGLGKVAGLAQHEQDVEGIEALWLAVDAGEPVGAVMLRYHGCLAVVGWLAVREDHRGGGLGRRLLATVEEQAARRGVVRLWATARAPGFFLRHGYATVDSGPAHDYLLGPCVSCDQYGTTCTPRAVVKVLGAQSEKEERWRGPDSPT